MYIVDFELLLVFTVSYYFLNISVVVDEKSGEILTKLTSFRPLKMDIFLGNFERGYVPRKGKS